MSTHFHQLLNGSLDLADQALEVGSDAAHSLGNRVSYAARTLRRNPELMVAGGLLVGFVAAGVYFGTRHWREKELERLRAERRRLAAALRREERRYAEENLSFDDTPVMADGRSPAEIDQDGYVQGSLAGMDHSAADSLTGGPDSQSDSVLEAEYADRSPLPDDDSAAALAEDLPVGRRTH